MRQRHLAQLGPGGLVAVAVTCQGCNRVRAVGGLDHGAYLAWVGGTAVQTAFPGLRAADRELLISGTCDECWREMWAVLEAGE